MAAKENVKFRSLDFKLPLTSIFFKKNLIISKNSINLFYQRGLTVKKVYSKLFDMIKNQKEHNFNKPYTIEYKSLFNIDEEDVLKLNHLIAFIFTIICKEGCNLFPFDIRGINKDSTHLGLGFLPDESCHVFKSKESVEDVEEFLANRLKSAINILYVNVEILPRSTDNKSSILWQ